MQYGRAIWNAPATSDRAVRPDDRVTSQRSCTAIYLHAMPLGLSTSDYDFDLPEDSIAQAPLVLTREGWTNIQ